MTQHVPRGRYTCAISRRNSSPLAESSSFGDSRRREGGGEHEGAAKKRVRFPRNRENEHVAEISRLVSVTVLLAPERSEG